MAKRSNPFDRYDDEDILRPSEVAKVFRVNPKTVSKWAKSGKLRYSKTDGGHRRYKVCHLKEDVDKVQALYQDNS